MNNYERYYDCNKMFDFTKKQTKKNKYEKLWLVIPLFYVVIHLCLENYLPTKNNNTYLENKNIQSNELKNLIEKQYLLNSD